MKKNINYLSFEELNENQKKEVAAFMATQKCDYYQRAGMKYHFDDQGNFLNGYQDPYLLSDAFSVVHSKNGWFAHGKLCGESKEAWMDKEEGSYEDYQNKPRAHKHVYQILSDSPAGFWVARTEQEADTLLKSAAYQQTWDDPSPETRRMMFAAKQISKKLKRLLNK